MRSRFAVFGFMFLLQACGGRDLEADPLKGGLAIATPADNSVLSANSLHVVVDANGPSPERVQLTLDGTLVDERTTAPFLFTLDVSKTPDGDHQLVAQAFKGSQNWLAPTVTLTLDRVSPAIASRQPKPGASEVDLMAPIRVSFTDSIDPRTAADGGISLQVADGGIWPAEVTIADDGRSIAVVPHTGLSGDQVLTVFMSPSIADAAGNKLVLPPEPWSWTAPGHLELGLPSVDASSIMAESSSSPSPAVLVAIDSSSAADIHAYEADIDSLSWNPLGSGDGFDSGLSSLNMISSGAGGAVWILGSKGNLSTPAPADPYQLYHWNGSTWGNTTDFPFTFTFEYAGQLIRRSVAVAGSSIDPDTAAMAIGETVTLTSAGQLDVAIRSQNAWNPLPSPGINVSHPFATYLGDGSLVVGEASRPFVKARRWVGSSWSDVPQPPTLNTVTAQQGQYAVAGSYTYGIAYDGNLGAIVTSQLQGNGWVDLPTFQTSVGVRGISAFALPNGDLVVGVIASSTLSTKTQVPNMTVTRWRDGKWTKLDPSSRFNCSGSYVGCAVKPDSRGRPLIIQYGLGTTLLNEN